MKSNTWKIIVTGTCLFAFALGTQGATIAHWRLDETSGTTATDSGPESLDGTYRFNPGDYTLGQPGKFNTAVAFDGTWGDVEIADGAGSALDNLVQDFTVTAWIKPDAVSGVQRILSTVGGANKGWGFGLNGAGLQLTTYGHDDLNSSSITLTAGVWTHVAVTFNSSFEAAFYVNGTYIEYSTGSAIADTAQGNWYIANSSGQNFDGVIDEIHVYDTVLNEAQIHRIMTHNAYVPEPSTAGLFILFGILCSTWLRRYHKRIPRNRILQERSE